MRHLNVSRKPSIFKSNQVNVDFLQGTISKMSNKPKINLSHLIDGLPIEGTQGTLDREISSIVFDSRKAETGSLFVAIRGLKDDGFKFIDDAIARGASAFITEVSVDGLSRLNFSKTNATAICAKDCRIALALVSSEFYKKPSNQIDLYGVTGTNGKTTVTYILNSIYKARNEQSGMIGTIRYSYDETDLSAPITTPESLDINRMLYEMNKQKIRQCFLEVSSHSLALKRVYGMYFTVGIFTNLSRDHLDFHGTMDNYSKAKKGLFRDNFVEKAVTNVDDYVGREIANEFSGDLLTTGIEQSADVMAENCRLSATGSFFTMKTPSGSFDIKTYLLGRHNIYNLISATAAALLNGISVDEITKGLQTIQNVPGRFEKVSCNQGFSVVVDYAHTDDALRNAIQAAQAFTSGRVITVFGCGGNRDQGKRKTMGLVATEESGFTIVTSDNPRKENPQYIINDILEGIPPYLSQGKDYEVIVDREEAIRFAIHLAGPGDLVLIAGKGHENYQILKAGAVDFDDKDVAAEIMKGML